MYNQRSIFLVSVSRILASWRLSVYHFPLQSTNNLYLKRRRDLFHNTYSTICFKTNDTYHSQYSVIPKLQSQLNLSTHSPDSIRLQSNFSAFSCNASSSRLAAIDCNTACTAPFFRIRNLLSGTNGLYSYRNITFNNTETVDYLI